MRIDKTETILGYSLSLVRDLLRRIGKRTWTETKIATHFRIPLEKASRLAGALVARGFLDRVPGPIGPAGSGGLVLTALGAQLCTASFLEPLPKSRAEAMIADLPARIDAINARDELVFRIAEVHVFGSLLRGDPETTAIELAVRLEPRRPGASWHAESFARAQASGQRSLTIARMTAFGATEVLKLLRAANRYLRLVLWETFDRNQPSRRIYPRPTPTHEAAGERDAPGAEETSRSAGDDGSSGRFARVGTARDGAPRNAVFRNAVFRNAVFRNAVSRNAVSRDAVSRDGTSRDGTSRDGDSSEATSSDGIVRNGISTVRISGATVGAAWPLRRLARSGTS